MGVSWIVYDFMVVLKILLEIEYIVVVVFFCFLERVIEFVVRYKIVKVYGFYKEFVEDEDVEVVYVGIIYLEYVLFCKLVFSYGKYVFCEKFIILNFKNIKELFDLVKVKGFFIMEVSYRRIGVM